jgi:hypothetical protein
MINNLKVLDKVWAVRNGKATKGTVICISPDLKTVYFKEDDFARSAEKIFKTKAEAEKLLAIA